MIGWQPGGGPTDDRDTFEAIRAVLLADARVRAAWIFGSRARPDAPPRGDVDLALLLDQPVDLREELLLRAAVTKALGRDDVDLVVLNHAPPLLRYEVVAGGRRLFTLDEGEADELEERAVREYLDTAWLRQTQHRLARQALAR